MKLSKEEAEEAADRLMKFAKEEGERIRNIEGYTSLSPDISGLLREDLIKALME